MFNKNKTFSSTDVILSNNWPKLIYNNGRSILFQFNMWEEFEPSLEQILLCCI